MTSVMRRPVGPVALFAHKNLAKIFERAIFHGICGIDDDGHGLVRTGSIHKRRPKGQHARQQNWQKGENHDQQGSPHLRVSRR